jgi:hypothetical protein
MRPKLNRLVIAVSDSGTKLVISRKKLKKNLQILERDVLFGTDTAPVQKGIIKYARPY